MADPAGQISSQTDSLAPWAAPYVTEMLGRGEALASEPYTGYTGPLTAGASELQDKYFQGIGALSAPTGMGGFNPTSFTGAAYAAPTAQQAVDGQMGAYTPASGNVLQQYMTPYLQGALQPQYDAAMRQAQIQQLAMQSQYGKAGAYGGGRQAVAGAELDRGLLDRMAGITGTGYQNAYEQAQKQFNTEQDRQMDAQQQTNKYGFDVLGAQGDAGGLQRAIEAEGIAADMSQFQQERDDPYKKVQYMQSLLQGLPVEALTREYVEPSDLATILGYAGSGANILGDLFRKSEGGTSAVDSASEWLKGFFD
jgi:hypothetical protein